MAETAQRAIKGKGMDGFIARMYDTNARKHIMEQYRSWAQTLTILVPKEDTGVLHIAAEVRQLHF